MLTQIFTSCWYIDGGWKAHNDENQVEFQSDETIVHFSLEVKYTIRSKIYGRLDIMSFQKKMHINFINLINT